MKRALSLLLATNSFYAASASVYLDLDTREGTGINDGKPIIIMSRGNLIVKLPDGAAAVPEGTEHMKASEKLVLKMNDEYYQKFSIIFEQAIDNGFATEVGKHNSTSKSNISYLPVIPSSISRKNLNGTSNRYLSMIFTEDEFIPAKPARTIPGRAAYYAQGKPGKLKCKSTGGYQCLDFNRTVCFNNLVQTKCKTVGGSPGYWVPAKAPQYIPAVPARTVTHRRQLTIDCDDQTYDIKNDAKGWKSYWQNATVSRLAQETCPAIGLYPLR